MSEHFIKEIEIKNYKLFKDFKASGFGRVNLIGGKNNVGKTAFMEAVYVNVYSKNLKNFIASLKDIKFMRENLNILENVENYNIPKFVEQSNNILVKSNINNIYFHIDETTEGIKKYAFQFQESNISINSNEFSFDIERIQNIDFIDNFGKFNNEIISAYSSIQKKDKENFLNIILNKFDARIKAFKIIDDKPQCKVHEKYLEITELGDGVRHLISIVTSLHKCENGYLFIDELDNGIHYTMLDKLWKIILEISRELNVQVFATTHSKECIESYARVAKKLEDKEIRFLSLYRDRENILKSITFDYEKIQERIELGLENR